VLEREGLGHRNLFGYLLKRNMFKKAWVQHRDYVERNTGALGILKGLKYKHFHSYLICKPRNGRIVYYEVDFFFWFL